MLTDLALRGGDGTCLIYDEEVVERHGVVPRPLAHLLLGWEAVHGCDGEAHLEGQQLFVDAFSAARLSSLGDHGAGRFRDSADGWPRRTPFSLHDELVRVYVSSVLAWAGLGETACQSER